MAYKVLIPTAGTGSRLGGITKHLNKSLVSIDNKPALSRIFEMFPEDTEYVIATGYKGELVKEFISLAYPEKKITFVDILLYEGEGSGLGLTISTCKQYLQCPFVFCSCDTLVNEHIPAPDHNWMGFDKRDSISQYRTLRVGSDGYVESIDEKGENISENSMPYIGLAGIYDYKDFWTSIETGKDSAIKIGEAYGLRQLIKNKIKAVKFTWFDTGVTVELEATRKRYAEAGAPNILEKPDEAIWFLKDKVIKFSANSEFISDRVKRARLLGEFVPEITAHTTHMYCYNYIKGTVLSSNVNLPIFKKLLAFSQEFWKKKELSDEEKITFKEACVKFYKTKTEERIKLFYMTFNKSDNADYINDVKYPTLTEMLHDLDWDRLTDGIPCRFHGDYHFENILYDQKSDRFKFIDWRQNFGKLIDSGDIYYDLAKLLHGLIISHELIAKDEYSAVWTDNKIEFDFTRKQKLIECEKYYYLWLADHGYDVKKVKILTALIYLNIAALHHFPYVLVLYALGKQMLYDSLYDNREDIIDDRH